MATLPTPTLSLISTFDPSKDNNIYFSYDGNQIEKKRIIIVNNKTFETVLDDTQLGMRLCYDLPANTIKPVNIQHKFKYSILMEILVNYLSRLSFIVILPPLLHFQILQVKLIKLLLIYHYLTDKLKMIL